MWDLIVSVPDHCLSIYFTYSATVPCSTILLCLHYVFASRHVQLLVCMLVNAPF